MGTKNIKHSGIYDYGENLSWGLDDPYIGWYDEEKAYSDFINDYKSKHPEASDKEIIEAAKKAGVYTYSSGGSIGHYLNIINSSFNCIGMGYSSTGEYGRNHSQDFWSGTPQKGDVIMTVDEFEKKLTEYENKIDAVNKEYKAKQDAVANASDVKDNSAVLKAQKALDDANAQLDSVKNKLEAPAAKQKELNAKVTEANKALVAANTEVANKARIRQMLRQRRFKKQLN